MALTCRLLSRSKQLYASQIILQHEHRALVRSYAKEAAPAGLSSLKGDEMLKNIFYEVKNKFEMAIGIFRKEKITIDPDVPDAVSHYAKVMKTVREKAGLYSESQKFQYTIQTRTQDIPDARTYLLTLKEIRAKLGIRMEDLPKYEEELELKIAKADLEEIKKDALEAMETQLKREEFKDEKMVDVKSLDIRNFL